MVVVTTPSMEGRRIKQYLGWSPLQHGPGRGPRRVASLAQTCS
jgi:hypothetical protein